MAVNLSPVGGVAAQFFDNNGNVLSGGKLFTYAAGTTTPAVTYTSSLGNTPQPNPIVLDAAGRVPASGEIWLTDGVIYKFVLQTSTNVLIATYDNITGINSNFVNFTAEQEIQTATAGQTVFNLTTMQYQPGTNSLTVYVDGVNQYGPGAQYAYLETDSDTVTFVSGLHVGASVKFTTTTQTSGNATDASVVAYTPPFTGGVTTNVEDKLAQYVSVKDFGAVGDGVTDDTAAFVAAKDYVAGLGGGIVHIPVGVYVLTDFDIDQRSVLFEGETSGYAYESVTTGVRLIPSSSAVYVARLKGTRGVVTYGASAYSGFKNVQFKFAAGSCNYGLFIDSGSTLLEEVEIQGFPYGCVLATWANSNRFKNCSFTLNTEVGFAVPDSLAASTYMFPDVADIPAGTNFSTMWSMEGCTIRQNNFGMVIRESTNVSFDNCVFESNTQAGLYVYRPDTSSLRALSFNNCWFENNYDGYTSGSTSYTVVGNKLFTLGNLSTYIAWTSAYQAGYQFVIDSQTHAGGGPDTFLFKQLFVSANIPAQMGFFIIAGFKFEFIQPVFAGANNTGNFAKAAADAQAIVYIDPLSGNNPTTTIPSLINGNGMGSAGAYYRSGTVNDGTPTTSGGLYPIKGVFGGPIRFPAADPADTRWLDQRVMSEYLQGTFAPSFTGLSGSSVSASGFYTKIGNRVFFTLEITGTNLQSTAGSTTCDFHILPTPFKNGVCSAVDNSSAATSYGNGWLRASTPAMFLPTFGPTSSVVVSGSYQTAY